MIRISEETVDVENLSDLCDLLRDCVAGGASIGFMAGLGQEEARAFWLRVGDDVDDGMVVLLAARDAGRLVGAVQLRPAGMPNQRHRADVSKLMVHSDARRRGVARLLMQALEGRAIRLGRHLLVLDTARGSAAEPLYRSLGWTRAGEIPWYALMPDGEPCTTVFFWKSLAPLPPAGSAAPAG